MTKLWSSAKPGGRYTLAIVGGLLLAAAFPKIGAAGLAWVAPALIVAAALGTRPAESFRLGYAAGLAYYLASYYWLLLIPYRWHGLPLGPALGWLALSAYLALYPALWTWIMANLPFPWPASRTPNSDRQSIWASLSQFFGCRSWWQRTAWCLIGAAVWVGLEMILARLFSGFPWDLLGVSQYRLLPLIQIASVTGVYGVSFLVVWVSLALLSAAATLIRQPSTRSPWFAEVLIPFIVSAVLFNIGFRQLRQEPPADRTLRVTLIQPSIPQSLIWDQSMDDERFQEMLRLSREALTNATDLLIWPEAALPKLLRYDQQTFDAVTSLAREHRVWMIIGADDMERTEMPGLKPGERETPPKFYNSSFLISSAGVLEDRYQKRGLVIFGEYIPLERWLPFLKFFTPIPGGFTRGQRPAQFQLPDLGVQTSVLICFEDIFPGLGRDSAEPDTDFLVNLTNNGWFGNSAAQWQHGATSVFRAVENRIPLVRCANNGLTCLVDEHGR
ncbi:MAG TPA: apolipoprotein N-acyltransferase, partial [Clostridia bacterium]|nr:apolipoprotein N-acyltransferase [Clostridia bacterium]